MEPQPEVRVRRFDDASGRSWEVVAGRESWGALVALFVPLEPGESVREVALRMDSYEVAHRELDAMDEGALRALLERSVPKSME